MGELVAEGSKAVIANLCGSITSGFLAAKAKSRPYGENLKRDLNLYLSKNTTFSKLDESQLATKIGDAPNNFMLSEIFNRMKLKHNDPKYFSQDNENELALVFSSDKWTIFKKSVYDKLMRDLETAANAGLCATATVSSLENFSQSLVEKAYNPIPLVPLTSGELLGTQVSLGFATVLGSNWLINRRSTINSIDEKKEQSKIISELHENLSNPINSNTAHQNILTLEAQATKVKIKIDDYNDKLTKIYVDEKNIKNAGKTIEKQIREMKLRTSEAIEIVHPVSEERTKAKEAQAKIKRDLRESNIKEMEQNILEKEALYNVRDDSISALAIIIRQIEINNEYLSENRTFFEKGAKILLNPVTSTSNLLSSGREASTNLLSSGRENALKMTNRVFKNNENTDTSRLLTTNSSSSQVPPPRLGAWGEDLNDSNWGGGKRTRKNNNKNKRHSRRKHNNKRRSK